MGFVINIDTLLSMIPVLLEGQQYVLTYRFSQDHLELLFISIRAAGRSVCVCVFLHISNVKKTDTLFYNLAFYLRWLE